MISFEMVLIEIELDLLLLYLTILAINHVVLEVDNGRFVIFLAAFAILKHGRDILFDIIHFPCVGYTLLSDVCQMGEILPIGHLPFEQLLYTHRLI